jgi:hypothetical protein
MGSQKMACVENTGRRKKRKDEKTEKHGAGQREDKTPCAGKLTL